MVTNNQNQTRKRFFLGLLLAVIAITFLIGLERYFKPLAENGIYYQHWSSEKLMQTVSIEDLRDQPLRSLFYLHIQPPLYDGIRAVLAAFWRSEQTMVMLRDVDRSIYILWAICYGLLGSVVFWWISEITSSWFAFISSVIFLLHPAAILYATLLDATFISALFVLVFCYLLWRVKAGMTVSAYILVLSFLMLFFTRSIFQWPWLILLIPSLVLLKYPFRKSAQFFLITGLIVGLYSAKQLRLFHISSTSSFTGLNLYQSIGYSVNYESYAENFSPIQEPGIKTINVLSRIRKPNGSINFNNINYLSINQKLLHKFRNRILQTPPRVFVKIYSENLGIYMLPSSQYSSHVFIDRLPQRLIYDSIFSYPVLPVLLAIISCLWLLRANKHELLSAAGLVLPVCLIALICIFCERGENMRFKFFIEPILFVFITTQGYSIGKDVIDLVKIKFPRKI